MQRFCFILVLQAIGVYNIEPFLLTEVPCGRESNKKGTKKLKTIFVVDDNNVNLLSAERALSKHYRIFTMPSALKMFDLLEHVTPDLILLDIMMPKMDGLEALKVLKSKPGKENIPVIFLTSKNDAATQSLGLEMGAVDFISKPISPPILLDRIKPHMD